MTRHPIWWHAPSSDAKQNRLTPMLDDEEGSAEDRVESFRAIATQSTRICMETLNFFILYLRLVGLASPTITTRYSFHNARSLTTNLEKNERLRSLVIIKKRDKEMTNAQLSHAHPRTHTHIYIHTHTHSYAYKHPFVGTVESWRNSFTPLAVGTRNMC